MLTRGTQPAAGAHGIFPATFVDIVVPVPESEDAHAGPVYLEEGVGFLHIGEPAAHHGNDDKNVYDGAKLPVKPRKPAKPPRPNVGD